MLQGRRRDDGGHEGRDQAEHRADARRAAGAGARRPVRQHRARGELDRRRPHRAEVGRLRRDRSGLCQRPRLPEVLRHRLPRRRVRAERGGARDDGARDQVARRQAVQRAGERGSRRAARRAPTTSPRTCNIVRQYGLPCVVAINSFPTDTARELALVRELALKAGAETVVVHSGSRKAAPARRSSPRPWSTACDKPNTFKFLTPTGTPLVQQIEAIATKLYGAAGIDLESQARKDLEKIEKLGLGHAPVCMAKTHLSLSHDPVAAQPAHRLHPAGARPRAERRRRVRRRAVRRDAADAGSRQDAGVHEHRHRWRGPDGRTVLERVPLSIPNFRFPTPRFMNRLGVGSWVGR